ncbi:MAG: serine/threonine-protein kinase [Candidatus Azobacteroides sp.]|nr:serine/threonine-protein kinase [Candidatus Azobacteroides sp.]
MAIIRLQSETDKLERQFYEFDPETGELGKGGMGVVYKGRLIHTDTGRVEEVAIKALYRDLTEEGVKRALREADIRINHDNVILMRGSVSLKDGSGKSRDYVISEYLDGETLDKQLARNGKLSKPEALNIIKNVLSGLSALHSRNLVHRDIDPSNIMICKDGRIKIIDLGVVKDMNVTGAKTTKIGQFIGKYEYASPEQLAGLQDVVKQTSDIYSTGIVLYELLTGKLPFTGTTYEITMGHKEKPIPLDIIPDKDLRNIIRKATAKKIEKRYQSTYEFIVAIEKALTGNSRPAVGKWLYATAAAVVIAAIAIVAFLKLPGKSESGGMQHYREALSQASGELALIHYPEALDAYRKAYDIYKEDSIAKKIESLELFSQGLEAYNRSDYDKADFLFRKVEGLGLADASYYLGEMYYEGLGVPKDFKKGFALVSHAFQAGFQPAGYRLGLVYQNGIGGIEADKTQAASYFDSSRPIIEKEAEEGNPEWLYVTGNMYRYGNGVVQSENLAVENYRKAAEKNYPPALYELYVTLSNEAPQQAMEYLTRSAQAGYVKAQSLLGRLLLEHRDKQGYEWIRQAAEKNYPYALAQVGVLHFDTRRLPGNKQIQETLGIEGDDALSQNYLQKALQYDSENYLANYGLGLYYYTDGSPKEAEKYFKTAQKQISELYKTPYREDELKYPNMVKIKEFIDYVVKK